MPTHPCQSCGGKTGHVPSCAEQQRKYMEEADRSSRFARMYDKSQRERFASLAGKMVAKVDRIGDQFTVTFRDGWCLIGRTRGGELAGHCESYSTHTELSVESPEEVKARKTAWAAFYEENLHVLHPDAAGKAGG